MPGASTSKSALARDASRQRWFFGCRPLFEKLVVANCWADEVVKQTNNAVQLLHKAFNGRVLCAYFSEVSALASAKQLLAPGRGRIFGQWLQEQIHNGRQVYLSDVQLPLQAACMFPGSGEMLFVWDLTSQNRLNFQ